MIEFYNVIFQAVLAIPESRSSLVIDSEFEPTNYLAQILLAPFVKRFEFHFIANDKTGAIDKPEWFYAQVFSTLHFLLFLIITV